jgi:hypothetical protein
MTTVAVRPDDVRRSEIEKLSRGIAALGGHVDFGQQDWAVDRVLPSFLPLISRSDIEGFLAYRVIRCQYALLVQDGKGVPLAEYTTTRTVRGSAVRGCVVPEAFWKLHEQGATVSLRAVDHWHPGCRRVAEVLADATGATVNTVAFLTPPHSRGLAPHRDGVNLLAVQCSGHKTWQVESEPSMDHALTTGAIDPGLETITLTLAPGHVLAMRPTVVHCADALEEPSLHVTFSVEDPNRESLNDGGHDDA